MRRIEAVRYPQCRLAESARVEAVKLPEVPQVGQRLPYFSEVNVLAVGNHTTHTPSSCRSSTQTATPALSLSLSPGLGVGSSVLATSPVRTRTPAVLGGLSFPPVYFAPRGLAVLGVNGRGRKRHAPPHYFERGA